MLRRTVEDESGISITEVLIAAAMGSVIATAFLVVFSSFSNGVSLEEARATALREVQAAVSDLAVELRQAESLDSDSFPVASLEASWPDPEIVFYSDRAEGAVGPEMYRYFVGDCEGTLCSLIRETSVADLGGPPWVFTGSPATETVVANVVSGGDPLWEGVDWQSGSANVTTSCGSGGACDFDLVRLVIRIDPEPNIAAEELLQVRHQVRLRNAP